MSAIGNKDDIDSIKICHTRGKQIIIPSGYHVIECNEHMLIVEFEDEK